MILEKNVPLDICIDTLGTYNMGIDGSIGKTYLYSLLYACSLINGEKYLSLTYDKDRDETTLLKILNSFHGNYICLDRMDLYVTPRLLDLIYTKRCIIFLDMKDFRHWNQLKTRFCTIEILKDIVRVTELK